MEPVVQPRKKSLHPRSWSFQPGGRWDELRGRSKTSRGRGQSKVPVRHPEGYQSPLALLTCSLDLSFFSWVILFCHLLLLCLPCHPHSLSPTARKKYLSVIKGLPKGIGMFPLGYQHFMQCDCLWTEQHPCSTLNTGQGAGFVKSLLLNVLRSCRPVSFISIAHSRMSNMLLSARRQKTNRQSGSTSQDPKEFSHTVA